MGSSRQTTESRTVQEVPQWMQDRGRAIFDEAWDYNRNNPAQGWQGQFTAPANADMNEGANLIRGNATFRDPNFDNAQRTRNAVMDYQPDRVRAQTYRSQGASAVASGPAQQGTAYTAGDATRANTATAGDATRANTATVGNATRNNITTVGDTQRAEVASVGGANRANVYTNGNATGAQASLAGDAAASRAYLAGDATGATSERIGPINAPTAAQMEWANIAPSERVAAVQTQLRQMDRGSVRDVSGGVFDSAALSRYMNPFEDTVVNNTVADMNRQRQIDAIQREDAMIRGKAFGGDRHGVVDAEADRNFYDRLGSTVGNLRSQGFQQAAAIFDRDATRGLQAGTANQNVDLTVGGRNLDAAISRDQFDAGNEMTARLDNARRGDARSIRQAELEQEARRRNADATDEMARFGTDLEFRRQADNAGRADVMARDVAGRQDTMRRADADTQTRVSMDTASRQDANRRFDADAQTRVSMDAASRQDAMRRADTDARNRNELDFASRDDAVRRGDVDAANRANLDFASRRDAIRRGDADALNRADLDFASRQDAVRRGDVDAINRGELDFASRNDTMRRSDADLRTRVSMDNAGRSDIARRADADRFTNVNVRNADAADRAGIFSAEAVNAARTGNADRALRGADLRRQTANDTTNAAIASSDMRARRGNELLQTGEGFRQLAQDDIDRRRADFERLQTEPFERYLQLGGILNGVPYTRTTTGTNTMTQRANPFATVAGLGMQAAGMYFGSDRRLKHGIKRIGTLANGLGVYTYRYLWSRMAHIGVMADEVERVRPEAVKTALGFKVVNYDLAVA